MGWSQLPSCLGAGWPLRGWLVSAPCGLLSSSRLGQVCSHGRQDRISRKRTETCFWGILRLKHASASFHWPKMSQGHFRFKGWRNSLHLLMRGTAVSQLKEYGFREDWRIVTVFIIYHSIYSLTIIIHIPPTGKICLPPFQNPQKSPAIMSSGSKSRILSSISGL